MCAQPRQRTEGDTGSFSPVNHPHRDIRFATTEDGVSIAHWEIGTGEPVFILHNFGLSHAELEWTVPAIASFYMDMAETYRVIRFDPRGIGLSGEPPSGWNAVTESGAQQGMSSHEMGLDVSAVASALELDSFALLALSPQGPVCIEYAATHPQVAALILCESFATTAASYSAPLHHAELALSKIEADTGQIFSIWERVTPPEEINQVLNLVRNAVPTAFHKDAWILAQEEWDAEHHLADIAVPTLILCTRSMGGETLSDSRHLAAAIAGSQLRVLDGTFAPYYSHRAATLEAIDAFLRPNKATSDLGPSGFRTVVFTDIVGSTEYTRRVGDELGRTVIRELETQVASLATDHGGRVVKDLGDGSLVSFGSNSSAITFALDLQDACGDGPLQLRVGMAAGEPIQEDGDIHGTVVAHASRIADLGEAGEVIVSDSVRQLAAGKGFTFEPSGDVTLKGFDEPERVWKVTQATRP